MMKKLIQHGNSVALVLDKPILELLNITVETPFEITTDGKNLILSPQIGKFTDSDIMISLEKINKKYKTALKRLGEWEMIRFLSLAEIMIIYEDQIRNYGGTYGVRDISLLSSALNMPQSSFDGNYLHKTIPEMAAAISHR